ncbi:ribonuclease H-like domain-containing protein [Tanacetum coccineum]
MFVVSTSYMICIKLFVYRKDYGYLGKDCKSTSAPCSVPALFSLPSTNSVLKSSNVFTLLNAKTTTVEGVVIVMPITTTKEKAQRRLEAEEGPNYALMAFSSLSPNSEFVNKPVVENCKAMSIEKYLREIPNDLQEPMRNWNSGCLRHMIGNMSYLIDYEEIDGGYVAFGGNPKGGKITGKGTIKTDDYSRFTWVFFLTTKDETSCILKSFITGIENRIDHKVKVIICDNGTEFKNREMNQFCEMKGILRQFSVARTPQQNGVSKRRNMTLIEAARTMLADSKLPTTFWAEVVNTACYVQNRVLVVKPHNKTPYELFHGRTLTLSFKRPIWSPVPFTIPLDQLSQI